jgi:predicted helicase
MANLQLNYETTIPWQLNEESKDLALDPTVHYRVEKMAFAKTGTSVDKSTIIYNSRIRLSGIPPETYQYVVNGKSAIEWVMERYAVTVDKDSGIKNDPNLWSDDARYIIDMVKRVVRVSVETVRIVKALPTL